MSIKPIKLGIASAAIFALFWVICSVIVYFFSGQMMSMTGHMVHANLSDMHWTLTWSGFFVGLVSWAGIAGVTAWLIAATYNMLTDAD
jgi:hypothetical protein